jgi:hypothetical protein
VPFMRGEFVMQYIYINIKPPLVFLRLFLRLRCAGYDKRTANLLRCCDIAESSRTNLAPVRDKGSCERMCVYQRSFFSISTLSVRAANRVRRAGGGGFSLWLRIKFLINSSSSRGVKIFLTRVIKNEVNGVAQNRLVCSVIWGFSCRSACGE